MVQENRLTIVVVRSIWIIKIFPAYSFLVVNYVHLFYSLAQVIKKFACQLDEWLRVALDELPQSLRNIKFDCKYRA